ncbi:hypothetical protein BDV96DRAFT_601333 [Lophiotrema nucula]|uniref:Uncharacterized protein n=1 Tax=Lophiotrema nucula TaxID=690887 RepID=A0A6A5Z322_9PLEO|nr:hypothetical protein BDV96DRAFT_601333 [Lophiotrema nucula]
MNFYLLTLWIGLLIALSVAYPSPPLADADVAPVNASLTTRTESFTGGMCRFKASIKQVCLPDKKHHSTYWWTASYLFSDNNGAQIDGLSGDINTWVKAAPDYKGNTYVLHIRQDGREIIKAKWYDFPKSLMHFFAPGKKCIWATNTASRQTGCGVCSRGPWSLPDDKFCEQGNAERYFEMSCAFSC